MIVKHAAIDANYLIIGGGIVGLSVGFGLLQAGYSVTLIDESDSALRASRGNFGLIWVQGKGVSEPAYARWTQRSATLWPEFARAVEHHSDMSLNLEQSGGLSYYLDEAELYQTAEAYKTLAATLNNDYPFDVLNASQLCAEEPNIGPGVAGGILHHQDGHVNPLRLLAGLAIAFRRLGGQVISGQEVTQVKRFNSGIRLMHEKQVLCDGEQVVLCAGLGADRLGPPLGFHAPVRAQRGHILITSKLPPLIRRPSDVIRQVNDGGVQIGASAEEVGPDDRETLTMTATLSRDAITLFPKLATANLVRSWAALRIMSPDGYPIYQQSPWYANAWFVTCHSGVTLAAVHAVDLPQWIVSAENGPDLSAFSENRFRKTE